MYSLLTLYYNDLIVLVRTDLIMETIMETIDFKEFRDDMKQVLAIVGKKYGIALDIGNISYDRLGGFKTTLTAVSSEFMGTADSDVDVKWVKAFATKCSQFNFTLNDLNTPFRYYDGREVTIIGLRPQARCPIIIRMPTNKLLCVRRDALTRLEVAS